MDQWLKLAKESAVVEAEYFVECIRTAAQRCDVEFEWFFDEVIKNMHRLKDNAESEGET